TRDELLGLDQYVLADADLAEIVQESCVAELLQLIVAHEEIAELPGPDLVEHAGEARGQTFDTARVTGGARISLLDRGHARLDETVEQRLDRIGEGLVVERTGGVARGRFDHLQVGRLNAGDRTVDG